MSNGKLPAPNPADELTARQKAFVAYYVEGGGTNGAEAARQAGYAPKFAKQKAYELLRLPRIQAALDSEIKDAWKASAVFAQTQLRRLAEDGSTDAVRLQATLALLDRAGYLVNKHHVHTHEHNLAGLTTDQLRDRAAALIASLSTSERKQLTERGVALPIIDVEAVEVSEAASDEDIDFASITIDPGELEK